MKNPSLRLKRDKDGNLVPIVGKTPNFGHPIKVLPLTYGEARNYESFGELLTDWTPEDRFKLISTHIVEPKLDLKDANDLENNFDPFTVEDMFQAVFMYSGIFHLFDEDGNEKSGNE
jgi:hypothetical protein